MGCMGVLPLVGLVVVVAAIAAVVLLAVRHAGPRAADGADEPEAILARRLATGDVDVDEYHERASALRSVGQMHRSCRAGRRT